MCFLLIGLPIVHSTLYILRCVLLFRLQSFLFSYVIPLLGGLFNYCLFVCLFWCFSVVIIKCKNRQTKDKAKFDEMGDLQSFIWSYGVNVEESTIFSYSSNIFPSHPNFSFSIFLSTWHFSLLYCSYCRCWGKRFLVSKIFIFKVFVKEPCFIMVVIIPSSSHHTLVKFNGI